MIERGGRLGKARDRSSPKDFDGAGDVDADGFFHLQTCLPGLDRGPPNRLLPGNRLRHGMAPSGVGLMRRRMSARRYSPELGCAG